MATGSDGNEAPRGTSSATPRRLGRYTLLKRVAKGGMGEVLLASTSGIEGAERPVIVKMIREEHRTDASFRARFLDEARVQAQLAHSGVVSILDATTDDVTGEPYVVVEHVDGRNLGDVRSRALSTGARLDWSESVSVAQMIAEALGHVHDRRDPAGQPLAIVHRDLSPQNVMLAFTGETKLIDFGTARGQNRRCHTVAGVVFAKPGYVAPEVANGDSGDFRVDLYALGVMLWELCAGRRFLEGEAADHLAAVAAGTRDLPPIAASCGAPAHLDAVITKLTAHDREGRYASSREAARDLAGLLADAPSLPAGERGVRGRVAALLGRLFPGETSRFRREFARLVDDARRKLAAEDAPRAIPAPPPVPTAEPPRADAAAGEPGVAGDAVEPVEEPAVELAGPDDGMLPGTRWRLVRELGRGSFSVVWESEHADLGHRAALKVHPGGERGRSRFRIEARALARVTGPGVAQLREAGVASDGRPFTVLELLDGETLDVWAARRELSIEDVLLVGRKLLVALEDIHAARLVHRDLKPANVLCCRDGSIRVLDLGLARDLGVSEGDDAPSGGALALHGTPAYMAPEQASGVADERSDVYAVGCMLYELVAGTLPFDGDGEVGALSAKAKGSPEPLRERCPARVVPAEVDDLVLRALARHPSVRFPTALAMRQAIERIESAPDRRRAQRRRAGFAALAAAMAIGACVAALPHVPGADGLLARLRGSAASPVAAVGDPAALSAFDQLVASAPVDPLAALPPAIAAEERALRVLEEEDAAEASLAIAEVAPTSPTGPGELRGHAEEAGGEPAAPKRRAAAGRERRERRDSEPKSSKPRGKDTSSRKSDAKDARDRKPPTKKRKGKRREGGDSG